MSQLRYWVWLASVDGVRTISLCRVLEHFGGAMEAYFAPEERLSELEDLSPQERRALSDRRLERTEQILALCQKKNIRILTLHDAAYPDRLRQIADPPLVLYVRGNLPFLDELPTIAIVGTRKASAYGINVATRLGQEITSYGGCVVTGMALGVDGAAARGALLAGKPCVGVLGTAIDVNYPAANSLLIDDVASAGAVISEFPPLYPTKPENFPRRNRIISGLSCGACIVEAPVRSGALITANLALEQGRDVFAVPGNIDSPNSTGTNALIRDGAKAITGAQDILSEYEGLYPGRIQYDTELYSPPKRAEKVSVSAKTEIDKPQTIPYSDLESRLTEYTEDHRALLRCISRGETHVDEMAASTGFSAAKVLACMTVLTIRGAVKPLPGKRYSLNLK